MSIRNKPRYHSMRIGNTNATYNTPNEDSAGLQLDDQDVGFLPNRLTTAQRDAIDNPSVGLMIFNLTTGNIEVYNGSWTTVGSNSGGTLLSSGTITTPVAYLQFSMPTNYKYFKFEMVNIYLQGNNVMVYQFSSDGGSTWLSGPSNYYNNILYWSGGGSPNGTTTNDTYGAIGIQNLGSPFSGKIDMTILPGVNGEFPSVRSLSSSFNFTEENTSGYEVAPVLVNAIQIGPWFTDIDMITNGTYYFWGF